MKRRLIVTVFFLTFILSACGMSFEETYPAITSTSFTIVINEEYDIIQSSATTCDFVKYIKISGMEIIVERVARLNWNDRYVILEDLEKTFYLYDMETEEISKKNDYNSFVKILKKNQVNLTLRNKSAFEKQP